MPSLLHIDLEQISQIVKGRTGCAEQSLLFDRRWLRVSLGNDDSPEPRSIFSGNVLPGWLALMIAKVDLPVLVPWREEDAPSVLWHAHISEVRPAVAIYTHGRS
jgi:hypothetical protein